MYCFVQPKALLGSLELGQCVGIYCRKPKKRWLQKHWWLQLVAVLCKIVGELLVNGNVLYFLSVTEHWGHNSSEAARALLSNWLA